MNRPAHTPADERPSGAPQHPDPRLPRDREALRGVPRSSLTEPVSRFFAGADRHRSMGQYRRLALDYDSHTTRIERIRRAAIDSLRLRPGQSVLDVACGTGKALPLLARRVAPGGRVVGVEQSPEMAARARHRAAVEGTIAEVVLAPVEDFETPHCFDAMLLSFTQDVLQNPGAIERLLGLCRPGTRIAVTGLRFLPWWWGAPLNLFNAYRARHYMTTFRGMREPWHGLRPYCPDLEIVATWFVGSCYLATGVVRAPRLATAGRSVAS